LALILPPILRLFVPGVVRQHGVLDVLQIGLAPRQIRRSAPHSVYSGH